VSARTKIRLGRKSDRVVPRQLLEMLRTHIPGFDQEKYAFQIAWMLWQTTVPSRQHNHYLDGVWFTTKEIRELFGEVKRFSEVNRDPRYFMVAQHRNGAKKTFTNGYLPWPWLQKALDWSLEGGVDLVDERGCARRIESRAICSTDYHGNPVQGWKGVDVPSLIPVNVDKLRELAECWETLRALDRSRELPPGFFEEHGLNPGFLPVALQHTKQMLAEASGKRNPGKLYIRYVLHESGRLYAEGLNLQSCKSEIRKAALAGNWDVDIAACHFAIMFQMAKKYGHECKTIENYVRNRKGFRQQIAEEVGLSIGQAKSVITMIAYGAQESLSPMAAIAQEIGTERAERFFETGLYRTLKDDISDAQRVILKNCRRYNGMVINQVRRAKSEESKPTSLMAHLMQGVEAAALEIAVRACKGKVLLLQHDGFTVSEPINTHQLQFEVLEKIGYDLIFDIEQIEMPFKDLESVDMYNKKLTHLRNANIHAGLETFWPIKSGSVGFSPEDLPPVFPLPLPPLDPTF